VISCPFRRGSLFGSGQPISVSVGKETQRFFSSIPKQQNLWETTAKSPEAAKSPETAKSQFDLEGEGAASANQGSLLPVSF